MSENPTRFELEINKRKGTATLNVSQSSKEHGWSFRQFVKKLRIARKK